MLTDSDAFGFSAAKLYTSASDSRRQHFRGGFRVGLWQLSECLHFKIAAARIDYQPTLALPILLDAYSRLRQYSYSELAFAARTLPPMPTADFMALSTC